MNSNADIVKAARLLAHHDSLARDLAALEGERAVTTRVLQHLLDTGTPAGTLAPMVDRLGQLTDELIRADRTAPGRPEAPIAEQMALTTCAATVTAISKRTQARIPDALKRVASASGIDRRALGNWRDNINRAVKSDFVLGVYKEYLAELRAMGDEQFESEALKRIAGLGGFVRNPV
jgi:hypothetical protein